MPAPGRGVTVRQVGTVLTVTGTSCQVTVTGRTYRLPCLPGTAPGPAWVEWTGRAGLVLGPAAPNLCDGLVGTRYGSTLLSVTPATPDVDGIMEWGGTFTASDSPWWLRIQLQTFNGGSGDGYVGDFTDTYQFTYVPDGTVQTFTLDILGALSATAPPWQMQYQGGTVLAACLTFQDPD
jgi:hypothetical protein